MDFLESSNSETRTLEVDHTATTLEALTLNEPKPGLITTPRTENEADEKLGCGHTFDKFDEYKRNDIDHTATSFEALNLNEPKPGFSTTYQSGDESDGKGYNHENNNFDEFKHEYEYREEAYSFLDGIDEMFKDSDWPVMHVISSTERFANLKRKLDTMPGEWVDIISEECDEYSFVNNSNKKNKTGPEEGEYSLLLNGSSEFVPGLPNIDDREEFWDELESLVILPSIYVIR